MMSFLKRLVAPFDRPKDGGVIVDEAQPGYPLQVPLGWRFIPLCPPLECCAQCRFAGDEIGFKKFPCRRHSPKSEKVDTAVDTREWVPRYPIMNGAEWCGDFERKLTVAAEPA